MISFQHADQENADGNSHLALTCAPNPLNNYRYVVLEVGTEKNNNTGTQPDRQPGAGLAYVHIGLAGQTERYCCASTTTIHTKSKEIYAMHLFYSTSLE